MERIDNIFVVLVYHFSTIDSMNAASNTPPTANDSESIDIHPSSQVVASDVRVTKGILFAMMGFENVIRTATAEALKCAFETLQLVKTPEPIFEDYIVLEPEERETLEKSLLSQRDTAAAVFGFSSFALMTDDIFKNITQPFTRDVTIQSGVPQWDLPRLQQMVVSHVQSLLSDKKGS